MYFNSKDYLKSKVLNLLLILTSLIGYLEWGTDQHQFLFQAEGEIVSKLFTDPASVIHPFILFPLAGQILLLITLFQKKTNKILTLIGLAGLSLLLGFLFIIGLLGFNLKILVFSFPFLMVSFFTIQQIRNS